MFDNWMKKKEEIQLRIERTDKMVKDREEEITLLENQISYLEETIDSFMDEPDIVIKKLQAENAELEKKLKESKEGHEAVAAWYIESLKQLMNSQKKLEIAVEALEFIADQPVCYKTINAGEALSKIKSEGV